MIRFSKNNEKLLISILYGVLSFQKDLKSWLDDWDLYRLDENMMIWMVSSFLAVSLLKGNRKHYWSEKDQHVKYKDGTEYKDFLNLAKRFYRNELICSIGLEESWRSAFVTDSPGHRYIKRTYKLLEPEKLIDVSSLELPDNSITFYENDTNPIFFSLKHGNFQVSFIKNLIESIQNKEDIFIVFVSLYLVASLVHNGSSVDNVETYH